MLSRWLLAALLPMVNGLAALRAADLPNVVVILADDLGYGDVACFNPASEIPTPHLDQLAAEGLRMTDAHSPCTVCTPTRYSLLTGQMAFRIPRGGRVFTGAGGPSLIAEDRLTLPQMLRDRGYATACVGKWHVGLTFRDAAGNPINEDGLEAVKRIDFSRRIDGGPLDTGFDTFFGTACCPTTDWLYAFIEGDRVVNAPTKPLDRSGLPKHPYANDNRPGMVADDFDLERVDLTFLARSQQWLREHAARSPTTPFFLYHATQAVHLPSFPAPQFQGRSGKGPHGDFIVELDWIVGELMKTLEETGAADNTIVIFTSDHGYHLGEHDFWAKVSLRDESAQVPLIICVPGHKPAVCDSFVELLDLFPTTLSLCGMPVPRRLQGKDVSPLLTDPSATVRDTSFSVAPSSRGFLLRDDRWAFIQYGENAAGGIELFDMHADPQQYTNLADSAEHADVVAGFRVQLREKLSEIRDNDLGQQ